MEIVTGDCRGADEMIRSFATGTKRKVSIYRADWLFHGKAAGPIRNQHMLDEGKPDLVLAFHDNIEESKGTKDMVRRALKAGIPTILFGNDEIRSVVRCYWERKERT